MKLASLPNVLRALAVIIGFGAVFSVPNAIFMTVGLMALDDVPADIRAELMWHAIGTVAVTLLLLFLALWLAQRATSTRRVDKDEMDA